MLHIKMLGVRRAAICCYSNDAQSAVRNKKIKAERRIRLTRDENKIFGPLLENKKEKMERLNQMEKDMISTTNSSIINSNDKEEKKSGRNPELAWAMSCTNAVNLKFVKKISKSKITTETSENENLKYKFLGIKTQNSDEHSSNNAPNVEGPGDHNRQNVCNSKNTENEIKNAKLREKSCTRVKESNDLSTTNVMDDKTTLKSKSNYDIQYHPIIDSTKSDVDQWKSSEILSLCPKEPRDFTLPGVTRILHETMSEEAKLVLENWKKKMIQKLGVEGFQLYSQKQMEDSKIMHSLIENTLKNEPINIPDHLEQIYNSANSILKDVKNVRLIESHVIHPTLGYRGFVDCVASYKGNVCLIDWKKSNKLKTFNTMYDSPLQVSAYIGALNSDLNYPFKVKKGLLAFAYASGQPPSIFELSATKLEFYWKEWLKRLEKYYATRFF